MSGEEILAWWEELHGELSEAHRQRFLERPETDDLTTLPRSVVEEALLHARRLRTILRRARYLAHLATEFHTTGAALTSPVNERARPSRSASHAGRQWKWRCAGCRRDFVAAYADANCFRCGDDGKVAPVCRSCDQSGELAYGGACRACFDARQVAAEQAGRGAQGPPGTTARDPDRRKRRWTGQMLDGPD